MAQVGTGQNGTLTTGAVPHAGGEHPSEPALTGWRTLGLALACALVIGGVGGLIGLGGGEFRLPVLVGLLGFAARAAVPMNQLLSLVTGVDPTSTLVAKSVAGLSGCPKRGEARAACLRDGRAGAPFRDPDQVDRGGGEDVLQARFGQADVAAPAQAAAVDGLRVRALDAGAGGVICPERLGFLVPARALQRLEVLARLQPDDARLALAAGAARAQRT